MNSQFVFYVSIVWLWCPGEGRGTEQLIFLMDFFFLITNNNNKFSTQKKEKLHPNKLCTQIVQMEQFHTYHHQC